MTGLDRQRGAALIVVLLLVATLAFVVLAISERTSYAAARSVNVRARSEMTWLGLGVETLAASAIISALKFKDGRLTDDNPLLAQPLAAPFDGGEATIEFVDRTRCFNVNAIASDEAGFEKAVGELRELFRAGGARVSDVGSFAATVADWIDVDSLQLPGGAEDSRYIGLPTPYRTGGRPIADISELRALAGVDADLYHAVRPWLCAQPATRPSPINVNMLRPDEAPLLVGLMEGAVTLADAVQIIQRRPAGGYPEIGQFWASQPFAGKEISEALRARTALQSRYMEARAVIRYYESEMEMSMLFEVVGDEARLVSRRWGPDR